MTPALLSIVLACPVQSPDSEPRAAVPEFLSQRPGLPAQRRVKYRWSQVWRAAMRMIRVDRNWRIDDSNQEAGFLLFHDPIDEDQGVRGSIELVAMGEKNSGSGLLVRAKVNNGGTHAAFILLEALQKKLRADFGPPAPAIRPTKDKPKDRDKGGDKDKGKDEAAGDAP